MATKKKSNKRRTVVVHKKSPVMAKKRRRAAPHKAVRRRRVGAAKTKTDIMPLIAVLGGVVAGKLLTKVIPDSMSATIKSGIVAAAGAGAYMFVKNKDIKMAGAGMFAAGGLSLAQSMGVLNGLDPSGQIPFVIGANQRQYAPRPVKMIAGYRSNNQKSGGRKVGSYNMPMTAGGGF